MPKRVTLELSALPSVWTTVRSHDAGSPIVILRLRELNREPSFFFIRFSALQNFRHWHCPDTCIMKYKKMIVTTTANKGYNTFVLTCASPGFLIRSLNGKFTASAVGVWLRAPSIAVWSLAAKFLKGISPAVKCDGRYTM